jgi:1-acyl-sn-glycerol-3-phosphate acyltransferase
MTMTQRDIRALQLQTALCRAAFPIVGPAVVIYLRVIRGYRIRHLAEVRRAFRAAVAANRPTVICANHLTMIDSLIMHHVLSSLFAMFTDFRLFSWNVPAIENFKKSRFLSTFTYLGKTIPIDRAGAPAHHRNVLEKLAYLVSRGEICTIFPEGGRSRTGRIDPEQVTYGIGQIVKDFADPLVVCLYVRGKHQTTYSYLPRRGDEIYVDFQLLEPKTEATGLRRARDIARQVIFKLKEMEDRYFAIEGDAAARVEAISAPA